MNQKLKHTLQKPEYAVPYQIIRDTQTLDHLPETRKAFYYAYIFPTENQCIVDLANYHITNRMWHNKTIWRRLDVETSLEDLLG